MWSSVFRYAVLISFFILISACGGGGGDSGGGGGGNGSLSFSKNPVNFTAERNGNTPTNQFVSISFSDANTAGILVGWPKDAGFTIPSWISLNANDLTGNSNPVSLRIRVNTTNLAVGTHSTRIRVVSGDANNNLLDSKDISISYTITPERTLTVAPTSFNFTGVEGASVAAQLATFTESTGNIPAWTSTINYSSGLNWLTITPSGDRSSLTLDVTPQTAGTYQATISISYSLSGVAKTLDIPVTYTATSIAIISNPSLSFTEIEGNIPAMKNIDVSFVGGANITWNATASYISGSAWLNLFKNGNSLTVQTIALLPGTYQGNIAINYTTALGASSTIIPVTYIVTPGVSVSQTSIVVNAVEGQALTPIALAINYTGSGTLTWTSSVVFNTGNNWLNVTPANGVSLPANSTVALLPRPVGVYNAELTIKYSFAAVTNSIVIPVTYTATTAWSVPASATFTLDSTSVVADLQQVLTIADTGVVQNWTASSNKPWLGLSPTTGDTNAANLLTLDLISAEVEKLTQASNTAVITLTPSAANVKPAQITVNLVNNLPVVNYVAPYVAYTDSVGTDYVVIRGRGFTGLTQDVKFGAGLLATNVTIISDTEIHVTPPVLAAGRFTAHVSNPLNIILSQADLLVKAPTTFTNQSLTTNLGESNRRVIYDAEREVVFSSRCYFCTFNNGNSSVIVKFTYNVSTNLWEFNLFNIPLLLDIAMTPDGKNLLAVTTTKLLFLNPDTMAIDKEVALAFNTAGTTYQLAVLNTGIVIFRTAQQTYNLLSGEFGTVDLVGSLAINTSPDGGRAVGGDADNSGTKPLKYYDASNNTVITTSVFKYYNRGIMSTHAQRLAVGSNLFDKNFVLLGTLPGVNATFGSITPDGSTVYGHLGNIINVLDVSGAPPYSVSATLTSVETGVMVMSPDASTLFSVGPNSFTVRDTSTAVPVSVP